MVTPCRPRHSERKWLYTSPEPVIDRTTATSDLALIGLPPHPPTPLREGLSRADGDAMLRLCHFGVYLMMCPAAWDRQGCQFAMIYN